MQGGIATIVMDDGKANALSLDMQSELNAALDQAVADRAMVVLAGRPGRFSAGFDLGTMSKGGADAAKMLTGGFRLAERLLTHPKPVVVACTGHALAMGVFLTLCGDYIIGADGEFKIGANEVAIGLNMPYTAIEICRARLAPAALHRAMTTSEIFSPRDALAAGFLDRLVAEADVVATAQATAAGFSKLNLPAHAETKQRLRAPMAIVMRQTPPPLTRMIMAMPSARFCFRRSP